MKQTCAIQIRLTITIVYGSNVPPQLNLLTHLRIVHLKRYLVNESHLIPILRIVQANLSNLTSALPEEALYTRASKIVAQY